ncbi:MAG: KamA family protein, partial [Bacteroidales bacterium]|nr:KamA family protein [Bacteroidales bacterium]
IIKMRANNKDRIIRILINKINTGLINKDPKYHFEDEQSFDEKYQLVTKWWNNQLFHLKFAIRDPDELNDFLGGSLDKKTMATLHDAKDKGIPFFVNPYYLSLLNVDPPEFAKGTDQAIRDYVFYSDALINEYGHIVAWEKEDEVEAGKPNAAGWLLPGTHNIHRRYPEVAILIPDTVGRACGGLCASCQRMYDFQRGNLNFKLEKLRPKETWDEKLEKLLRYWEEDSQLRDILITGGDALMTSNRSLEKIFDAFLKMVVRKKEANLKRADGEKYAEMLRVRLGTRLPVYLPQRITPELIRILRQFKKEACKLGIKQFFIQTHFESPMEVTPEASEGIQKLISAGWTVTNQMVFTTAASRRGHSAKLRKVLNEIGVINYYSFTVKGYLENSYNFATNERAVQEQLEEKALGQIPRSYFDEIRKFPEDAENIVERIADLKKRTGLQFLGTDRNVINLPGVGKSLTFRTIGVTRFGRRILEFDYDKIRNHSPVIREQEKVVIIESKSIRQYLNQIEDYGENPAEYESIWGYSIGVTEARNPMYDYPEYSFKTTDEFTNLG